MKLYEDTLNRFVEYLSEGDDDRFETIEADLRKLLLYEMKTPLYNTHIALMHCKSFEEIAPEFSKWENKKKPLTPDAIRKRYETLLKTIKQNLEKKHGNKN